ncbi:MAG TPA: hypothetical protein VG962_05330 [Steroidobacteraceae bacterium]|nr:hypothetical protein [Steroidobacteraceae bacterium]
MKTFFTALAIALTITGCTTPTLLAYSSGFSFANYDYIVVGKPDGRDTNTSLYGMDIEFANLMSRYNMKVIGNKEYDKLSSDVQKRTLNARMSVEASNKRILLSVSFDDAVTGRTGASITTNTKGNIFNADARSKAFESASKTIIKALQRDKDLQITEDHK